MYVCLVQGLEVEIDGGWLGARLDWVGGDGWIVRFD